jgi:hypothetical protein
MVLMGILIQAPSFYNKGFLIFLIPIVLHRKTWQKFSQKLAKLTKLILPKFSQICFFFFS